MSPQKTKLPTQLPKAPLTEVVFEIRWKLEGSDSIPPPLKTDPGYSVMADRFISAASENGFGFAKRLADPAQSQSGQPLFTAPYAIEWRFYKGQEKPFPLWQIGPGIFAANDSAAYEWNAYKKMCLRGARVLMKCYPKMQRFKLEPNYLELRYLDSFALDATTNKSFVDFLNANTSLSLTIPSFVAGRLKELTNGQLIFNFSVNEMPETTFAVIIGSGVSRGIKSVILQSKVITRLSTPSVMRGQFVSKLNVWLEKAHRITSPFFKQFVQEHLMKKFGAP